LYGAALNGCTRKSVVIVNVVSYVPYGIQQAALILAARLYQRKASPLGIVTGFADYGIARISRTDPDVAALLQPHKRIGVA
jgi:hypothetical protein